MKTSKDTDDQSPPMAGHLMEMLIKTIHRLHLQFEAHLSDYGIPASITGPRLRFLATVAEAGKLRMSEAAAKCGIAPRTVTQFVDALEQAHLLVRIPDPDDRRATLLQLTDAAIPLVAKARVSMNEAAERTLAALPSTERSQLLRIMKMLAESTTPLEEG